MGRYRKIDARIWNDEKFNRLTSDGKLVWFFLLTHPHMTALGSMRATSVGLAAELNGSTPEGDEWTRERFLKSLAPMVEMKMVEISPRPAQIFIPNFVRFNAPESTNVVKAWRSCLEILPESDLTNRALEAAFRVAEDMGEAFREAFGKAFGYEFAKARAIQRPETRDQRPDKEEEDLPTEDGRRLPPPTILLRIFEEENRTLPKVIKFTESRKSKARIRLRQGVNWEGGVDGYLTAFREGIRKAQENGFLSGDNERGWRVTFDWLIENDAHLVQILEGKYDRRKPKLSKAVEETARKFIEKGKESRR